MNPCFASSTSGDHLAETLNLTPAISETLIPGLPDDIAAVVLALLPFSHHARLRLVSHSWAHLLLPATILPLRRLLRLPLRHLLLLFPSDPTTASPLLLDPTTSSWTRLPPLPISPNHYFLSNFSSLACGPHIYILGGSHFDARSYPLGHPSPSAAVFRLDLASGPLSSLRWEPLPDMRAPRGSFACASIPSSATIIVAGGGSRHPTYPSDGTRIKTVEWFDIPTGRWCVANAMPRHRAGCVGFLVRNGGEEEFLVMGGYGDYQTVARVVPADVYCRDTLALRLRTGEWREVGDMWEEGERRKLGLVAAVEGEDGMAKGIFMLDANKVFR